MCELRCSQSLGRTFREK